MTIIKEMQEVRIYYFESNGQRQAMELIYKAGLKKDKLFWFLPEPKYLVIRYSKKFDSLIKKLQTESFYPVKFEYSNWIEASDDVAKHADAFTKIMHECSVIALEGGFEPFRLFERIAHCMFLTFSEAFEIQYPKITRLREAAVLTNIAIGRAETEGFAQGKNAQEVNHGS